MNLRFKVQSVTESIGGAHIVVLTPDYEKGANSEWAEYTPAGRIELNLSKKAAVDFYTNAMRSHSTVAIEMTVIE